MAVSRQNDTSHAHSYTVPGIVQFAALSDTMLRQYVSVPVANGIPPPPRLTISQTERSVPRCRIVCLRLWHCCRLILLPPTRLPPPPPGGRRLHAAFPYLSHPPSRTNCASCFQSICRLHRSLIPAVFTFPATPLSLSSSSPPRPLFSPLSPLLPGSLLQRAHSSILYRAVSRFAL